MAPGPVGGVRVRTRGAGRADDDPPDDPEGRRVDGRWDGCRAEGGRAEGCRVDGRRAEGSARGLSGVLVEGRDGFGDGRGCAGLGRAVSGGRRVLWSGTSDRRWSVGRPRARSPAGGEVTRPRSGLPLGGAARSEGSARRVVVGGVETGGEATRPLPVVWSVLGRPATEGGSSRRPCRTTVIGVPASPRARSLNSKRGRAGLRGPTITTRSARYR